MVRSPKPERKRIRNENMTKSEIRSYLKRRRNDMPISLRRDCSKKIQDRLYSLNEFRECKELFTYISFGSEVDTYDIIKKSLEMNKKVFVPKVEGNDLCFYEIEELDMGLIRSKFGILEPESKRHNKFDILNEAESDGSKRIMLLPGLAFDKQGNRIGYGAGYYDRYLNKIKHRGWIKLALAYDFQVMERLTVSEHDIPADYIITEKDFIICKEYLE
jgi:5-formyltetrahydrofolate cyclo-ligase